VHVEGGAARDAARQTIMVQVAEGMQEVVVADVPIWIDDTITWKVATGHGSGRNLFETVSEHFRMALVERHGVFLETSGLYFVTISQEYKTLKTLRLLCLLQSPLFPCQKYWDKDDNK